MRIAILTSGILPVPAVKGGAVESLIDLYLEYNNRGQLRQWLEVNHSTEPHSWVTTYRGKTPMPNTLSYLLHILLKIFATIRIFYQ